MDLYQHFQSQKILNAIPPGPVIAAVSGGADSMVLLHLMKRLSKERRWTLTAAHVQHHLRGRESLKDQKFVEAFSKKINTSFQSVSIPVSEYAKKHKRGIEESARILRYQALAQMAKKQKSKIILTGHTGNDQAETFLLNLIRGSGLDGLCGMSPITEINHFRLRIAKSLNPKSEIRNPKFLLIRPLLSFERQEILNYARSQKIAFRHDSTNAILKYRRNWIRHKLIPLIQHVQPKIIPHLSKLTALFQQHKQFMQTQIQKMEERIIKRPTACPPRFIGGSNVRQPARRDPARAGAGLTSNIGRYLDLPLFFRYDIYLRYYFLHHIMPDCSYSEIEQLHDNLKKQLRV